MGSLARYSVASLVQSAAWPGFPWGIFTVNITGGFVMGVLTEALALKFNPPEIRAFLMVGVMGGYTTFSSFSLDSALLIERGAYASAAAYIGGLGGAVGCGAVRGALDRADSVSVEAVSVDQDDDGIRLDRWFKRHYPALGHGPLEKLLRTGRCGSTASAPRRATAWRRGRRSAFRRKWPMRRPKSRNRT